VGKVDYEREYRYYLDIAEQMSDTVRARKRLDFSRTGGGMIDEYIVDYEDYVGIGSGAFSFLEGALVRELVLAQGVRGANLGGQDERRAEAHVHEGRPDAVPVPDVAVRLRLDKRQFVRDFGVTIDFGLASR